MRKTRCLFLAALLAVATAVAVPAMAADAPAGPAVWTVWWQELAVWIERLSPFGGNVMAASSDDPDSTTTDADEPPPDDGPIGTVVAMDEDEPSNDSLPGVDPNGGE